MAKVWCKSCERLLAPGAEPGYFCPDCAIKERRRTVRDRNSLRDRPRGTQWQLGIRTSGRWCRQGCCDLNNPQHGDCRF